MSTSFFTGGNSSSWPPYWDTTNAEALVRDKYVEMEDVADRAVASAEAALAALVAVSTTMEAIDAEIGDITTGLPGLDLTNIDSGSINEVTDDDIPSDISTAEVEDKFDFSDFADSPLLDTLKGKLNDGLKDPLAFTKIIENLIMAREQERDQLLLQDSKDNLAGDYAERGFDLPPSILGQKTARLQMEHENKMLDKSREIYVRNQELSLDLFKHYISEARSFEGLLMQFKTATADRKIQAARILMDTTLAKFDVDARIFNSKIERYKVQLERYKNDADIRAMLNSERLQQWTAQLKRDTANADVQFKQGDLNIREYIGRQGLLIEAAKATAQISSQQAAAAMTAVSTSASISSSRSDGQSVSKSIGESWNHSITEGVS